ncbi:EAL domain-containing protein [Pelomonas sp. APW6]|uniref:EAL domain-containing protein n=1 Tax=Roseateles subflavus TaxID=3053353 RepID=A0ABT7LES1_9BURK|nr:GGDEF and EAL domain-containing protein [Pelomonas sp. APW6]MDL5031352.1 EAL domain-containing protein [Pelomonas sp. APW6]
MQSPRELSNLTALGTATDAASVKLPALARQWLDHLPEMVWLANARGQLSACSGPLQVYVGLPESELIAQGWRRFMAAEELALLGQAWPARQPMSIDLRLRNAQGELRWHLCLARPLMDHDGSLQGWMGSFVDIDARKRSETLLREADAVWKLALESTGDGVWDWRVNENVETFSPRYLQMYGYDPDEIAERPDAFDALTHPDDVSGMVRDRLDHFEGRTPAYVNEHRVRCKDGSWKWVLSRGMVIARDESGRPLRMVGTHTDITARKEAEVLIWQQANFDPLTGLPNRRMLRERLEREIRRAREHGHQLAVLFIDLDHFKEVNDTLGHGKGDLLLQQAAQRIRESVRPADVVARMGGDEFTVLLSPVTQHADVDPIVELIIERIASPFRLEDERAFVSASVGISLFPDDGEHIEALFKHADQALYVAKDAGRNRYSYFTPALQRAALNRMRLSNDLRDALAAEGLQVVYQPIVDLRRGHICKAEALVRWHHAERGPVPPAEFIPIAESSGLILEIGEWVFRQAVQDVLRWRTELDEHFQISVNKSPVQFHSEAGMHTRWLRQIVEAGLPGDAVSLEITEGLLLEGGDNASQQLMALRRAGLSVALDDFGTGYSSLSYLQRYEIDCLKIDRVFVHELEPGSKALALCRAIITMAHELGMTVIAEGVETARQRDLLASIGCDLGQGFFFARPMPAAALEELLRQQGGPRPA